MAPMAIQSRLKLLALIFFTISAFITFAAATIASFSLQIYSKNDLTLYTSCLVPRSELFSAPKTLLPNSTQNFPQQRNYSSISDNPLNPFATGLITPLSFPPQSTHLPRAQQVSVSASAPFFGTATISVMCFLRNKPPIQANIQFTIHTLIELQFNDPCEGESMDSFILITMQLTAKNMLKFDFTLTLSGLTRIIDQNPLPADPLPNFTSIIPQFGPKFHNSSDDNNNNNNNNNHNNNNNNNNNTFESNQLSAAKFEAKLTLIPISKSSIPVLTVKPFGYQIPPGLLKTIRKFVLAIPWSKELGGDIQDQQYNPNASLLFNNFNSSANNIIRNNNPNSLEENLSHHIQSNDQGIMPFYIRITFTAPLLIIPNSQYSESTQISCLLSSIPVLVLIKQNYYTHYVLEIEVDNNFWNKLGQRNIKRFSFFELDCGDEIYLSSPEQGFTVPPTPGGVQIWLSYNPKSVLISYPVNEPTLSIKYKWNFLSKIQPSIIPNLIPKTAQIPTLFSQIPITSETKPLPFPSTKSDLQSYFLSIPPTTIIPLTFLHNIDFSLSKKFPVLISLSFPLNLINIPLLDPLSTLPLIVIDLNTSGLSVNQFDDKVEIIFESVGNVKKKFIISTTWQTTTQTVPISLPLLLFSKPDNGSDNDHSKFPLDTESNKIFIIHIQARVLLNNLVPEQTISSNQIIIRYFCNENSFKQPYPNPPKEISIIAESYDIYHYIHLENWFLEVLYQNEQIIHHRIEQNNINNNPSFVNSQLTKLSTIGAHNIDPIHYPVNHFVSFPYQSHDIDFYPLSTILPSFRIVRRNIHHVDKSDRIDSITHVTLHLMNGWEWKFNSPTPPPALNTFNNHNGNPTHPQTMNDVNDNSNDNDNDNDDVDFYPFINPDLKLDQTILTKMSILCNDQKSLQCLPSSIILTKTSLSFNITSPSSTIIPNLTQIDFNFPLGSYYNPYSSASDSDPQSVTIIAHVLTTSDQIIIVEEKNGINYLPVSRSMGLHFIIGSPKDGIITSHGFALPGPQSLSIILLGTIGGFIFLLIASICTLAVICYRRKLNHYEYHEPFEVNGELADFDLNTRPSISHIEPDPLLESSHRNAEAFFDELRYQAPDYHEMVLPPEELPDYDIVIEQGQYVDPDGFINGGNDNININNNNNDDEPIPFSQLNKTGGGNGGLLNLDVTDELLSYDEVMKQEDQHGNQREDQQA